MGYFQVRYDSRVVIYEHKLYIRLATGGPQNVTENDAESFLLKSLLKFLLIWSDAEARRTENANTKTSTMISVTR